MIFCVLCFVCLIFETIFHYVTQTGLKLTVLLPQFQNAKNVNVYFKYCLFVWRKFLSEGKVQDILIIEKFNFISSTMLSKYSYTQKVLNVFVK
jgi:hypothetical protein